MWILLLILAGLILISGCSSEDETGAGDYAYDDSDIGNGYSDSYPVMDTDYDDTYKYEQQQRLREIQEENAERIEQLQEEQRERDTNRLVEQMKYG